MPNSHLHTMPARSGLASANTSGGALDSREPNFRGHLRARQRRRSDKSSLVIGGRQPDLRRAVIAFKPTMRKSASIRLDLAQFLLLILGCSIQTRSAAVGQEPTVSSLLAPNQNTPRTSYRLIEPRADETEPSDLASSTPTTAPTASRSPAQQLYAERRNFGQRVALNISTDSLLGRTIGRLVNSNVTLNGTHNQGEKVLLNVTTVRQNSNSSLVAAGKLELISKLFSRYRLPRAKLPAATNEVATKSIVSTAKNSSGSLAVEESAPYHMHLQHLTGGNATSDGDYQVVRLSNGTRPRSGLEEVMRASKSSPSLSAADFEDNFEGNDVEWARHRQAGEQGQVNEGGGRAKEGFNWEAGHRKHGWKNVYHRDEVADHQKFHDLLADKSWAGQRATAAGENLVATGGATRFPLEEENFRYQRGNNKLSTNGSTVPSFKREHSSSSSLMKHNPIDEDDERYNYVRGADWRRSQEDASQEGDEGEVGRKRASSPAHFGDSSAPSSDEYSTQHSNQQQSADSNDDDSAQVSDNSVEQIKEKLERLSGEQAHEAKFGNGSSGDLMFPVDNRRESVDSSESNSQQYSGGSESGANEDEEEQDQPEGAPALSGSNSNSSWPAQALSGQRHHNIQDILKTTKGMKVSQRYQPRVRLMNSRNNSLSLDENYDELEDGGNNLEDSEPQTMPAMPSLPPAPLPMGQHEKPAKKDEKIRLKLELDVGKSSGENGSAKESRLRSRQLANSTTPQGYHKHLDSASSNYTGRAHHHHHHHHHHQMQVSPKGMATAPHHHHHPRNHNESRWFRPPATMTPMLPPSSHHHAHQLYPEAQQRPLTATKFGLVDGQLMGFREPASSPRRPSNSSLLRHHSSGWVAASRHHQNYSDNFGGGGHLQQGASGLRALQQVLPSRPIFVKHLEMNGGLVLNRLPTASRSPLSALNRSQFSGSQPLQLPLGVGEDMAVETSLSNAFGDILAIPGAALMEPMEATAAAVEAGNGHHEAADTRDYIMTYAGDLAPGLAPHQHHHQHHLAANNVGESQSVFDTPLISTLVEPAEPTNSATGNQFSASSFHSYNRPHQVNDMESLMSEEQPSQQQHQFVIATDGHHHRQPSSFGHLINLVPTNDNQLALHHDGQQETAPGQLVPQQLIGGHLQHPVVAHPHHQLAAFAAAASQLKPMNYATLLVEPVLSSMANAGLGMGSIMIPAMQHTFGRLLRLPRVFGPALANKQQLLSAASQLHLSVQRHLNPQSNQLLQGKQQVEADLRWRPPSFAGPVIGGGLKPVLNGYAMLTPAQHQLEQPHQLDLTGEASKLVPARVMPAGAALVLPARLVDTGLGTNSSMIARSRQQREAASRGGNKKLHLNGKFGEPLRNFERASGFHGNHSTMAPARGQPRDHRRPYMPTTTTSTSTRQPETTTTPTAATTTVISDLKNSHQNRLVRFAHLRPEQVQQPHLAWFNLHYAPTSASYQQQQSGLSPGGEPKAIYQAPDLVPSTTRAPFFGQRILTSFKNKLNG